MQERTRLHRIAVRNSPIHGRGVFALRRIPKGTRIIEYKGTLITDREADRRYSRIQAHSPHTMLFSVDDGLVID
ncbi:MAG TPA: SET domain-containing protein-lysine N-methyltransferase, partial [Pyrinomonadaceae bacterium]|nr:SET domain-containing protein-lysine N-methyltransferase [Candidatus Binatia bacterium]HLN99467.1 SET domain-containing protein-lysine N-methyltransferase [Pyrinomonadaceae bacterium]